TDAGVAFLLSYDGSTGERRHGEPLPANLGLRQLPVPAGRSAQATLHGREARTVESLYLSPALVDRLGATLPAARPQPATRPGTPWSSCSPASSKPRPAPATRSFTVCETSTSDGPAMADTLAAMLTAIPPALPSMSWISPVCRPQRTSRPRVRTASLTARAQ